MSNPRGDTPGMTSLTEEFDAIDRRYESNLRRRHGLPDSEVYLPYEIFTLATHAEIPTKVYSEIIKLANLLADRGIDNVSELDFLLGVHFDGKKWNRAWDTICGRDYADLVYEGRKLVGMERHDDIPSRKVHNDEMRDPKTSAQTGIWYEHACQHIRKTEKKTKNPKNPKISDRKLAVNATKRKNKDVSR